MFSISCRFQQRNKNPEKSFVLKIMASELVASKVRISRREYVYSAVNVLTNSPNILDLTKADFFQLNLSQTHGKIDNSSAVQI